MMKDPASALLTLDEAVALRAELKKQNRTLVITNGCFDLLHMGHASYLYEAAKQLQVPFDLLLSVHQNGRLPVVNFAAGGVATPADAALMMMLGAEGVFVGSGIFKSGDPAKRAAAIVKAVTNYQDSKMLAELSCGLGEAMVGINPAEIKIIMEERGI